jgi:hypothetical protein
MPGLATSLVWKKRSELYGSTTKLKVIPEALRAAQE